MIGWPQLVENDSPLFVRIRALAVPLARPFLSLHEIFFEPPSCRLLPRVTLSKEDEMIGTHRLKSRSRKRKEVECAFLQYQISFR
ncbi:hypothetical protein [Beijerinckia mobilis]|uniref:hypothetical protein n=1 Tax=Beijerinckia mobilis TaxID=231434 RepID=UPI00054E6FC7|nr:hypothetical protein [Beijerinckia mobilis]